ncbi:MAG TPA: RHS repeat-associated core domain-containing protein [Paludibacteraceae bacterium]|nr:RHS repeat-associated core domain-containing protein [Paludibacteraceae bacterium]HOL00983.1 RHS repeat-associated core domain-containing protein [Paludibacteraceae bacterium]HPO67937.1 RHS repeat-associated core domain-containing protein [Paludibacteraceae bacterium]
MFVKYLGYKKKYNGKEFVEMHGYDTYDYGVRGMYPAIMRFTTPDPLAEKYYSISPYAYCGNNPIKFVDLDGREVVAVSKETQKMILNTLPKEVRQYITFDKNGYINHENIKNIKSNSENFNSLKLMVLSENKTVKVEIDNKFFIKIKMGISKDQKK